MIAASVVLMSLALPWRREAQAYGNVFFSGLVLLIGLGLILRRGWYAQAVSGRSPRRSPSPADPAVDMAIPSRLRRRSRMADPTKPRPGSSPSPGSWVTLGRPCDRGSRRGQGRRAARVSGKGTDRG